jgi:hypothetical protein
MKIQIENISLSNDSLDNDNYVEIYFEDDEEKIISIDELHSALTAFIQVRELRLKKEQLLK